MWRRLGFGVYCTSGLLLSAQAVAQDTSYRLDNGDGTWSRPDDGSRTVGEVEWEGPLLWEYQGMARFKYDPAPWSAEIPFEIVGGDAPTRADRVLGSVKVDGDGRRWVVVDHEDLGRSDESFDRLYEIEEPEVGTWSPMTWSYSTGCVGDEGLSWMYQWDGESRGVFTSLTEDRHKKVVLVNTEVGTCTGVMVGPRDVLTAAHCVTDQDDPDVVVEVNAICSRGNSYTDADCVSRAHTSNIFEVTLNTSWTGGFANPSWDFALIEWASVSSPEDPDVLTGVPSSPMPISTMSNSEIEATTVRMYGHPAFLWDGSCQSQEDTSPVDTTMGMDGSYMAYEARTDHSVSSSRIKTNIDSNGGESGSPLHACPTGCSTGGEELVGLMTGWVNVGLDKYTGGPKAAQFADFVNDNL